MEVHYHFVKEKVSNGEIAMKQIKTDEQTDIVTKGLGGATFSKLGD